LNVAIFAAPMSYLAAQFSKSCTTELRNPFSFNGLQVLASFLREFLLGENSY
jgi:hypothetical protein